MTAADPIAAFVHAHTVLASAALVPEIELCLAAEPHAIFQAAERAERPGEQMLPFWAFAWPGGQAAARYLLDNPAVAAGRRVLDIGAGSGIASIAAAKVGAADVVASDIDHLAHAAIQINARANRVDVRATTRDVLGDPADADLVLIGDLVYEPWLATRVAAFLEAACDSGATVLLADRTTAGRPALPFDLLVEHEAPVTPQMTEAAFERARVWRLAGRRRGRLS